MESIEDSQMSSEDLSWAGQMAPEFPAAATSAATSSLDIKGVEKLARGQYDHDEEEEMESGIGLSC